MRSANTIGVGAGAKTVSNNQRDKAQLARIASRTPLIAAILPKSRYSTTRI
jgi:hypothetical protein